MTTSRGTLTGIDRFQRWLTTPTGSIARVLLGTLLGYAAAQLPVWQSTSGAPEVVFLLGQAIVPVLIAYLNPADHRMGRGKRAD